MSFADKMNNKAQEMRGRIKRNAGQVTGDRRLEAEGRAEERSGNLRQAVLAAPVVAHVVVKALPRIEREGWLD